MKIKLLLFAAVISLATSSAVSAHSDRSDYNERHDYRSVDRYNAPFSFSLVVPGPTYYVRQRNYDRRDYHDDYRHNNDHHRYNDYRNNNNHYDKHNRNEIQGFRGTR